MKIAHSDLGFAWVLGVAIVAIAALPSTAAGQSGSHEPATFTKLLSRVIWLTDQEYEGEAAARSKKAPSATQKTGNQD